MPRPAGTDHDQNYFARVAKYPTPRLIHPVRKVVFKIKSHDQGWGGDAEAKGTYRASWTWFEAGLEKFDAAHECKEITHFDKPSVSGILLMSFQATHNAREMQDKKHPGQIRRVSPYAPSDQSIQTLNRSKTTAKVMVTTAAMIPRKKRPKNQRSNIDMFTR